MLPEAEFGTPNQLHVHFTPDFRGEKHALRPELHVFRVKRPEETPCPGCACAHSRWRCRGPLTCSRSTARGGGARTRTRSPAGRPRCARRLPCARRGSGDRRPHTSFQSTLGGEQAGVTPAPELAAGGWQGRPASRSQTLCVRQLGVRAPPDVTCQATGRGHGQHACSVGQTGTDRGPGTVGTGQRGPAAPGRTAGRAS